MRAPPPMLLVAMTIPACAATPPAPNPLADFGPVVCGSAFATDLRALRKELGADAVAGVEWNDPRAPILEVAGTPCPGDAACKAAWDAALTPDEGATLWVHRDPEAPRRRRFVFAKGAKVVRVGSEDELLAALLPIDGPFKAHVLVSAGGGAGGCGEHVIRARPDGWELVGWRRVSDCRPLITERFRIHVDRAGRVRHTETIDRSVEPEGCR